MPQPPTVHHKAVIIALKKETDGAIAALCRCCDDPSTDCWHTFYVQVTTTADDITAWKRQILDYCETMHVISLKIDAILGAEL